VYTIGSHGVQHGSSRACPRAVEVVPTGVPRSCPLTNGGVLVASEGEASEGEGVPVGSVTSAHGR
jgi:hypothetical protein